MIRFELGNILSCVLPRGHNFWTNCFMMPLIDYERAATLPAKSFTHGAWTASRFHMGKNTPERKDYIMENLVMTVE